MIVLFMILLPHRIPPSTLLKYKIFLESCWKTLFVRGNLLKLEPRRSHTFVVIIYEVIYPNSSLWHFPFKYISLKFRICTIHYYLRNFFHNSIFPVIVCRVPDLHTYSYFWIFLMPTVDRNEFMGWKRGPWQKQLGVYGKVLFLYTTYHIMNLCFPVWGQFEKNPESRRWLLDNVKC